MAAKRKAPTAPPNIERFVKTLVVAAKAVALYPPASTIPRDTSTEAFEALREALRERSDVRLVVNKNGLFADELPIYPDQPAYTAFAQEFYNRKLAEVRFHAGTEADDIISFLALLKVAPEQIEASGGFESRLWDSGVATITVKEARISLIDKPEDEQNVEVPRLGYDQIEELLTEAYGGRPRDQVTIARVIGDPEQVAGFLTDTYTRAGGEELGEVAERFSELAEVADAADIEERHRLFSKLAEALSKLDPDLRRELLITQLLPESRTNDALASVIRSMDIDEVCKMFVEGMQGAEGEREGVARAIRNLALISMADRDEVMNAAGAAMRGAGFSEEAVSQVFESASPSRLEVRDLGKAQNEAERPADTIFKLMDLAPMPQWADLTDDDPAVAELQEEARRGITDGDVIAALVSLLGMDTRPTQFASTMSMLEDSLDILIARGDIDVAADVASSIKATINAGELEPDQRHRLERAIARFARPEEMKQIAHALRLYKAGTPEHDSAHRLLDTLGYLAIHPMLEQLAQEPDMAVRKSIVDLLSGIAPDFITELGAHVTDPRWYFVRNVVSVLGSTKSSAVLPYIERTIRHPEGRVRREAIRALSGIPDRLASEMLIAALSDDDAQNVQLAARYLGATGARGAVRALEQVARGEGRGNRDTGARCEAIEALGKLGSSESLPTLETLAGKRSILGAAKARELRAAAESALAAIRVTGGGAR